MVLLDAKESREIALKVIKEREQKELAEAVNSIEEARNNGRCFCTIDFKVLRESTKEILQNKGYKIKPFSSGINEQSTEITW
jgi:hypothetical protein